MYFLKQISSWGVLMVLAFYLVMPLQAEPSSPPAGISISWQPWSEEVFAQAKREHKFVLLDLQAVWCHWCHVMEEKTYHDPKVLALINAHYVAVQVDQDAHPDLANRYQDYGWPATIVLNADGSEIVKRQGYLPPNEMVSLLQAIIEDPSPGPSVTHHKTVDLSKATGDANLEELQRQFAGGYDTRLGGWGTAQKFMNWDNVEYCLVSAAAGDEEKKRWARQTLEAQHQLIDPVWGGVDQYSAGDDWIHPHFEKILQFQAENLRLYAEAYALWKNPEDLHTALKIYGYIRNFLTSPDGVVYTSQDADLVPGEHSGTYYALNDQERRKRGVPRVDTHIYARENGWYIAGLVSLYQASEDPRYREEAEQAAAWILQHRSRKGGGFLHGQESGGPISLADQLTMAKAFLSLYAATAKRDWLNHAEQTTQFIADHFVNQVQGRAVGYATAAGEGISRKFAPEPDFDENVSLARFANLLFYYTGNSRDKDVAVIALRYAGNPEVSRSRLSSVGALLLAEQEMKTSPLHVAIVGGRGDPLAQRLFATAVFFPCLYKQVEWVEGHTSGSGTNLIQYPPLEKAAAYVCGNRTCSAPVFAPEKLQELLTRKTSTSR